MNYDEGLTGFEAPQFLRCPLPPARRKRWSFRVQFAVSTRLAKVLEFRDRRRNTLVEPNSSKTHRTEIWWFTQFPCNKTATMSSPTSNSSAVLFGLWVQPPGILHMKILWDFAGLCKGQACSFAAQTAFLLRSSQDVKKTGTVNNEPVFIFSDKLSSTKSIEGYYENCKNDSKQ